MHVAPDLHLTYCTNIHAGRSLATVMANLQRYGSALRAALCPEAPLGIGLRLSGTESVEATEPTRLESLRSLLEKNGLYVFTMNGFPYGPFHGQSIKDAVHAPDWRDPERVAYTLRLADILATLLPEDMDGGISTSPLSYKPWLPHVTHETWSLFVHHIADVVVALAKIHERTGKHIHIDIEPEPDGLLETSDELVSFFIRWLYPLGRKIVGHQLGLGSEASEALLRKHVQVCWDTCHVAVAYESPQDVLMRYRSHDIRVGKIQVSSALKVPLGTNRESLAATLAPFVEPTYLHQVVQRNHDGTLTSFRDLDEALFHLYDEEASEWRIHFHVPIFLDGYGPLLSTQQAIKQTVALLQADLFTHHLEIETYTWEVLPPHLKKPLADSIQREFEWMLSALEAS